MHEQLWAKLGELDAKDTASRSKCRFDAESGTFTADLLGVEFEVNPEQRRIYSKDDSDVDANFTEQLCILAYLINSSDIPAAKKLVSGDKLDSGQFFFRGPHGLPTGQLEEVFGDEPNLLIEGGMAVHAKELEYGDASIEVAVLPRLPLVFVVWGRDEEFDARASILFDETATRQLPLDALGAAVQLAVAAITKDLKK